MPSASKNNHDVESSDNEAEDPVADQADFLALGLKDLGDELKSSFEKARSGKSLADSESRVIYLGRVPHGFYEREMKGFFGQFGEVLRLRLSRNKKTGKSKHYAFIEFKFADVAKVVAETMDGYVLYDHRLVCHIVSPDKVHERMFNGSSQKFRPIPFRLIARKRHNAPKDTAQQKQVVTRLMKKDQKKRARLAELGIDYEFPGYEQSMARPSKHIKFNDDDE